MSDLTPERNLRIAQDLGREGFSIVQNFISDPEIQIFTRDFESRLSGDQFKPAAIGQGLRRQVNKGVRGDQICWIETDPSSLNAATSLLQLRFGPLRELCNEKLFLGLWDWEAHYALYEPGSFYQRHLDAFQADRSRMVSMILYLNRDWKKEHGGELVLHPRGVSLKVEPRAGTFVCFLSDRIEHEVLLAHEYRRSIAAWFRRRVG